MHYADVKKLAKSNVSPSPPVQEALSIYKEAVQKMPRQFAPHSLFNMMGELLFFAPESLFLRPGNTLSTSTAHDAISFVTSYVDDVT